MKIELRKGLAAYDTENNLVIDRAAINCGCEKPRLIAIGSINASDHYISMAECQNCGNIIFTKSEE
jgi:hypothetical protein